MKSNLLTSAIYNAAIALYGGAVAIASMRMPKARLMTRGQRQTEKILSSLPDDGRPRLWMHVASLGEFEQGRPLLELIRSRYPQWQIILTFFSPSGYEVRKNFEGADCVCYLPFDTPGRVRRFLDLAHPSLAIFVKYEFWRNYLRELGARRVPTFLISGIFRPGQLFFRRHGGWYRDLLYHFSHLYVQDERSRDLLASVGVRNVTVAGDTRFDRVTDIMRRNRPVPELDGFTSDGKLIFMAGSSWPADEEIYASWLNGRDDVKGVIAPHEFDKARLAELKRRFKDSVLLSEVREDPRVAEGKKTLIIDCFGLLSSAYTYADIAYVGGGFGAGLHNINEAAVYGVPVIYGPNCSKFIEAAQLNEAGGGFIVRSEGEFTDVATRLVADDDFRRASGDAAAAYIKSKLGATAKVFDGLEPTLSIRR